VCLLDPDEDAVTQLSAHFLSVIHSIVNHTWTHYHKQGKKKKGKKKGLVVFDQKELEKKRVTEMDPRCFLHLHPSYLRLRLSDCRASIVSSFRAFDFKAYNPVVSKVFGEHFVLDPGSGLEELFPPRRVGRPKKQKLAAKRERKASDPTPLTNILGQAIDSATKDVYVLVQWAGEILEEATWTPLNCLSSNTKSWWVSQAELRFPCIDLDKDTPILRISGGLVTLIIDDSADEIP
jgi:hypothetical protein